MPSRGTGGDLTDRVARYVGEAVLPFYVLHQAPIVISAYYVAGTDIGPLLKFLVVGLASLAAALLMYDVCVRRTAVTRFLFGMRRDAGRTSSRVSHAHAGTSSK
jgi:glucan biosynthesis protein C